MSAPIECPHCKKRNFTSTSTCVYCLKPLDKAGKSSTGSKNSPTKTSKPPPPIDPAFTKPSSYSGSSTAASSSWGSSSKSPVPVPKSPYPTPHTPPAAPANYVYDTPNHLKHLGTAHLEGTVSTIKDLQVTAAPNITANIFKYTLAIILLPFRPLMVLTAMLFGHQRSKEKDTVYTITIEKLDGRKSVARVEGDVVTALPDRGEYVSIWGSTKGHVLLVKKMYNHTSDVEIILK